MTFKNTIVILILLITNSVFSQTKRAFIIAIGEYAANDGKGWKKISSVNDTTYLLPALRNQGFEKKNTIVLINEQASIEGIREALIKFSASLVPNDIVVIHISAHGAQIEDDNGDEMDGFDESIVSYNAIAPSKSTDFKKDQLQYMRDDEFGIHIETIRKALGPKGDVVVFMDNCHSGSGTRNVGNIVRGGEPALTSKKGEIKPLQKDASIFKESTTSNVNMASYVIISASRAEEANTEIVISNRGVGSLSFAISKAFEQMVPQVSYQGFFSQIQSTMNLLVPKQHPVIEGNGMDRSLFGGKYSIQPAFIEIKSIEDPTLIIVNAGMVSGLTKSSTVAIYPSGTSDTTKTKVSALGKIIWSDNYIAGIELDRALIKTHAFDYWVFIKKTHYPIKPVVVKLNQSRTKAATSRSENYLSVLSSNPAVVMDGKTDLTIHFGDKQDTLIESATDQVWQLFENNIDYSILLNASIERYMQYIYLKSYTIQNEKFPLTIKLLPYKNGKADTTLLSQKMVNGIYEFKNGDTIVVSMSNPSNRRIYFNIIDLQPDGFINAIFPKKTTKNGRPIVPEELFIEANTIDKVLIHYPISLAPPYGDEIFKVFISKDKLDLEYITLTKKDGQRSFQSDLEKAFKNSYSPSTRGDFGSKEGSVVNVNFRIIE